MRNREYTAIQVYAIGLVLFVFASVVTKLVAMASPDLFVNLPYLSQLIKQCIMLLIVLLGVRLSGMGRVAFGFRRGTHFPAKYAVLLPILLGIVTSVVMVFSPASGLKIVQQYGFLKYILFIWILSSIVEEFFVRGLLQSLIKPVKETGSFLHPGSRVLTSAAIFASMHLILLFRGVDLWTVGITFIATFGLGWITAFLRDKTESLVAPVVAHTLFNVGGFIGGIISMIIIKITTGQLPG